MFVSHTSLFSHLYLSRSLSCRAQELSRPLRSLCYCSSFLLLQTLDLPNFFSFPHILPSFFPHSWNRLGTFWPFHMEGYKRLTVPSTNNEMLFRHLILTNAPARNFRELKSRLRDLVTCVSTRSSLKYFQNGG